MNMLNGMNIKHILYNTIAEFQSKDSISEITEF